MANITTFTVPNIGKGDPHEAIGNAVRPLAGVEEIVINVPARVVNVEHDGRPSPDALKAAIERAGYFVQRYSDGRR